ncbi:sugar phosphate isomerase/epimerase [Claveliimonas bilis]|uniref:Xylose isomerase n=1 Tax=Claveliimonas bilis TaxID=3028070 RepID=A0ABM8I8N1_9FIRM|nr:sugar phosphate isomerase/epimerase family protein [Claveliimonas bilis]MCQ5202322.1 sugar phosphate isomerase/epimerase [Mordavella massiliensis]BDZ76334.1 xylose isomerase [Claveliimonas bilis]
MFKYISMKQIAAGNYTYPLYTFEYFLESMLRLGVENIELWAAGPHFYLGDFDTPMLKELKRKIQVRGLHTICLTPEQCAYPVNIGAKEGYIRKRSMKYFYRAIEAADVMEIPAVLVTPGDGYRNECKEDTWKYTVENLQILSDYGAKYGKILYLEHLTEQTTNIAVYASELAALASEVDRDNLICMADTDMMGRCGETLEDYFKATDGRLGHVHFVDGMPGGHLALGDGKLPLAKFLEELERASYKGYITLEITNEIYYLDPEKAIGKSLRWLKQYIS